MSKTVIQFIFYMFISRKTICFDYFVTSTIINISLFLDTNSTNNKIHLFFLKGYFNTSDRSLQYYFLEDIQFTHTSIVLDESTKFKGKLSEVNELLKNTLENNEKMLKIKELAKVNIKPFIFSFLNKNDNNHSSIDDLRRYEEKYFNKNKFTKNRYKLFTLYGNHFKKYLNILKVKDHYNSINEQVDVLIDIFKYTTIVNNESITTYKPYGFAILSDIEESYVEMEPEKFFHFNFANYGEEWVVPEQVGTSSGDTIVFNNKLKEGSLGLQIVKNLEQIFARNGSSKESPIKPVTHSVQSIYRNALGYLLNQEQTFQMNKIFCVDNLMEKYTIDYFNEDYLDQDMRGKYKILMELKPSFKENVLKTDSGLFKKAVYEKNIITNQNNYNKDKDDGLSRIKTVVIIIAMVLMLIVIGMFIMYYLVGLKHKKKKKFIK